MKYEKVDKNWMISAEFIKGLAVAYVKYENIQDVDPAKLSLEEITAFSFFGHAVSIDLPTITRGEINFAQEFADQHNCDFISCNARGTKWVLRFKDVELIERELQAAYCISSHYDKRRYKDWSQEEKFIKSL